MPTKPNASPFKYQASTSPGLHFMRVYQLWHQEVRQCLKPLELTHPQFLLLSSLAYLAQTEANITQVSLANWAGMDVMTVSQMLRLLEKKGWTSRQAHPQDTRAKTVRLTPAGQTIIASALPIVENIDQAFFGKLGHNQTEFIQLLEKLEGE